MLVMPFNPFEMTFLKLLTNVLATPKMRPTNQSWIKFQINVTAPETICFMASHMPDQLPVNNAAKNWIIPVITSMAPCMVPLMDSHVDTTMALITGQTFCMTAKMFCTASMIMSPCCFHHAVRLPQMDMMKLTTSLNAGTTKFLIAVKAEMKISLTWLTEGIQGSNSSLILLKCSITIGTLLAIQLKKPWIMGFRLSMALCIDPTPPKASSMASIMVSVPSTNQEIGRA